MNMPTSLCPAQNSKEESNKRLTETISVNMVFLRMDKVQVLKGDHSREFTQWAASRATILFTPVNSGFNSNNKS